MLAASASPLSVVIVGIGRADFAAMRSLDDLAPTAPGQRDMVQFVEFDKHRHSRTSLTMATLEEIPDQVVSYFVSRNIAPLPPPATGGGGGTAIFGDVAVEDPNGDNADLTWTSSPPPAGGR